MIMDNVGGPAQNHVNQINSGSSSNFNSVQNKSEDGHQRPNYTIPGILHFIQHEWARFEMERAQWEVERAEFQVCNSVSVTCFSLHKPMYRTTVQITMTKLSIAISPCQLVQSSMYRPRPTSSSVAPLGSRGVVM